VVVPTKQSRPQCPGYPRAGHLPGGSRRPALHRCLTVIDTDDCGVISRPACAFGTDFSLPGFVSAGNCWAWFSLAQSRFLEQPPAVRDRILDVERVFEMLLDQRRCPRQCVESALLWRFVDGVFEFV
jgi:hypothetical protein